jgi:DNA-binding NtrC family response regulator
VTVDERLHRGRILPPGALNEFVIKHAVPAARQVPSRSGRGMPIAHSLKFAQTWKNLPAEVCPEMDVVVADSQEENRKRMAALASAQGYGVREVGGAAEALAALASIEAAVLVTAHEAPGLPEVAANHPDVLTILTAAPECVELALAKLDAAAGFWFLRQPVDAREFSLLLRRAEEQLRLRKETRGLRRQLAALGWMAGMPGRSAAIRRVFAQIEQAAPALAPVLLVGEPGSGKEWAARALHAAGRRNGPFVIFDPYSKEDLPRLSGGTLFLRNLTSLAAPVQARLRRLESDLPPAVRVIASAEEDPAAAIRAGRLREDLFYRLSVFTIRLPPLRERLEDLGELAEAFVERANELRGTRIADVGRDALELLAAREWPGNLRELRDAVERAAVLARTGLLTAEHFQRLWRRGPEAGEIRLRCGATLAEAERSLVEATLLHAGRNKTRAAALLGISAKTLHAKLRQYREA